VSDDGAVCCCRRRRGGVERIDSRGVTYYVHRLAPAARDITPLTPHVAPADAGQRADPDTLHRVYTALLDALPLDQRHVERLRARGLTGDLRRAGYRTLGRGRARAARALLDAGLGEQLPRVPGLYLHQHEGGACWTVAGASGLLIPVRDAQGRVVALQVRADFAAAGRPRYSYVSSRSRGGPGPGAPAHVPLFAGDRAVVRVTEGAIKADVATALSGLLTVGLPGVGAWGQAAPLLRQLGARTARVAFDADARRNPTVSGALLRLVRDLRARGYATEVETWAEGDGKGIDDLLAAGCVPEVATGDEALAIAEAIDRAARPPTAGPPPRRLVRARGRVIAVTVTIPWEVHP
jgi:hypothetical protein